MNLMLILEGMAVENNGPMHEVKSLSETKNYFLINDYIVNKKKNPEFFANITQNLFLLGERKIK